MIKAPLLEILMIRIIRIGFWGILYCNHTKNPPPQLIQVSVKAPIFGKLPDPKP